MKNNKNNKTYSDLLIRIIVYSFIITGFLFGVFFKNIVNSWNISQAEKCYNAKNYICAFKHYKTAFHTKINDEIYVKHYFDTLQHLKKIALVQEELYFIYENYPDSKITADIENIFKEIRKNILLKYPDTYIENVVFGTSVVHWNNFDGKITVYIAPAENSKYPEYYIDEIKKAFYDYTKILENKVRFEFTNDENNADIKVLLLDKISNEQCENKENCVRILGLTDNNIVGQNLKNSVIRLRIKDIDNSDFTSNQIYNVAKHEIGHALGVSGHSFYEDDIMYPLSNDTTWSQSENLFLIKRKNFSTRDINTFKLLYNIIPEITDKHYNIKQNPNMYLPVAVLGTKKEIGEKKLKESQDYLNTVSSNFVSQINLAESYFANKNYDEALKTFSKALNYANSNEEKFTVYNNLAVIYYTKNEYSSALDYANIANEYSSDGSNEIIAYCYIEQKQYAKAQTILENLISKYPDNVIYSAALSNVYMKQYKYLKMFEEMKRIKKVDKSALQHPAYEPYKFFTTFI